jgi:3-dehydroquinate dehydratase-2
MQIIIINGPNLNLVGEREPEIYGKMGFDEFMVQLKIQFPEQTISYYQSNIEGEIINQIQDARKTKDAIVLNAGAYTHTSLAIGDAVAAIQIPVVEVHMSNVFAREEIRHHSYISKHAKALVCGMGLQSYEMAIRFLTTNVSAH